MIFCSICPWITFPAHAHRPWPLARPIAIGIIVSAHIVSAHRRILGLPSVVCVLVKIRVSSISLYKLDPDKLTTPFESAHQFTLVCTVSDFKIVPGCTTIHAQNHSFVLTD